MDGEIMAEENAGNQDGMSQEEIDAALAAANAGDAAAPSTPPKSPAPANAGDARAEATDATEIPQEEIDAALEAAQVGGQQAQADSDVDATAETNDDALEAVAARETVAAGVKGGSRSVAATPARRMPPPTGSIPLELPDFGADSLTPEESKGISMLNDVKLDVKIELGRAEMYIEEVLKLGEGAVVELDKLAGDPVDVLVNDRLVARGEVLVLNDNFCVRISEILPGSDEAAVA